MRKDIMTTYENIPVHKIRNYVAIRRQYGKNMNRYWREALDLSRKEVEAINVISFSQGSYINRVLL